MVIYHHTEMPPIVTYVVVMAVLDIGALAFALYQAYHARKISLEFAATRTINAISIDRSSIDEESGGSETSSIGEPFRQTINNVRATVLNPEFPKNIGESMHRNDMEALKRSNGVSIVSTILWFIFLCKYHSLHVKC